MHTPREHDHLVRRSALVLSIAAVAAGTFLGVGLSGAGTAHALEFEPFPSATVSSLCNDIDVGGRILTEMVNSGNKDAAFHYSVSGAGVPPVEEDLGVATLALRTVDVPEDRTATVTVTSVDDPALFETATFTAD